MLINYAPNQSLDHADSEHVSHAGQTVREPRSGATNKFAHTHIDTQLHI